MTANSCAVFFVFFFLILHVHVSFCGGGVVVSCCLLLSHIAVIFHVLLGM